MTFDRTRIESQFRERAHALHRLAAAARRFRSRAFVASTTNPSISAYRPPTKSSRTQTPAQPTTLVGALRNEDFPIVRRAVRDAVRSVRRERRNRVARIRSLARAPRRRSAPNAASRSYFRVEDAHGGSGQEGRAFAVPFDDEPAARNERFDRR